MKTVYRTPTLRAKTSGGKDKFWQGVVLEDDAGRHHRSSIAWTENAAGERSKPLESPPALVEPKNVGRANETSPFDQAVLEVNAKMAQKIDKGYAEEGKEDQAGNGFVLPMLAHGWAAKKHTVDTWPVYVQPKFDGTRMLYDSRVGHWSRQGKPYLPEVVAHIAFDTEGFTLDGELILPDGYSFQETVRAVKKFRDTSPLLRYRVYDLVESSKTTAERMAILEPLVRRWASEGHPVVPTPTIAVANETELMAQHAAFIADGHEGTMVRLPSGRYTPGQRSAALLKLKDFSDDEFVITGFTDGVGKDAGTVIFTCAADERSFQVRPVGTVEERRAMFENGASYLGKSLTVRFQGVSEDGVPRFPVGINVREEGL
jgi:DNA ligase-1